MTKKVLVVDLDGTLYNTNTFHKFLKFLLGYYFKSFKILKFIMLVNFMKLRFFRIISHARLKYLVLKQIQNKDVDFQTFVSTLESYKNIFPELSDLTFDIKILATAAPSCYAKFISAAEGFDVCLATDFPSNGFYPKFENLGEEKKKNLQNYLQPKGISIIDTCITDHIDDASIVKLATKSVIISPNPEFLAWLNKNLIKFEVRKP